MIDIDKGITVSGPCGCGQIAVVCTLRMILEKQTFFCDACGTEFSGEETPSFLSEAAALTKNEEERRLFADMQELSSFIYGSSGKISVDLVKRLLSAHPEYRSLFSLSLLPGEWIIAELKRKGDLSREFQEEFKATCPWGNFTASDWVELLILLPGLADRCNKWKSFTPEQWLKIKRQSHSVYSSYFNLKTLGKEEYFKSIASKPELLENAVDDAKTGLSNAAESIADAAESVADAAKDLWRKLW